MKYRKWSVEGPTQVFGGAGAARSYRKSLDTRPSRFPGGAGGLQIPGPEKSDRVGFLGSNTAILNHVATDVLTLSFT